MIQIIHLVATILLVYLIFSANLGVWPTLLLLVANIYVGAAVVFRLTMRVPTRVPFAEFDPGVHDATIEQLNHVAAVARRLEGAGFRRLGDVFAEYPARAGVRRNSALLTVLENDAGTRATATAVHTVLRSGKTLTRLTTDLTSRFADRRRITSNFPAGSTGFQHGPAWMVTVLPQVRDPLALAHVHGRLIERHEPDAPIGRPIGALTDVVGANIEEAMNDLVARGSYFRDDETGDFVVTMRGAVMLALLTQWPVNRIRERLARRRGDPLLRELGLDAGIEAPITH